MSSVLESYELYEDKIALMDSFFKSYEVYEINRVNVICL